MSAWRRAQRATSATFIAICCGLTAFASGPHAAELNPPASTSGDVEIASLNPTDQALVEADHGAGEPFAVEVSTPISGGVERKWRFVTRKLPHEHNVLAKCRLDAAVCTPAAARFLAVIEKAQGFQGWARIAEINRAINLDVRPVDDQTQYGVPDLWATPLMTLATNAGDCEDYAIAKYVALKEIGFPINDLRLVIVHDRTTDEDHAVAAVRHDGDWLILDNRTLEMRRDAEIADFDPLFVIDGDGVKHATVRRSEPQLVRADVIPTATEHWLSALP